MSWIPEIEWRRYAHAGTSGGQLLSIQAITDNAQAGPQHGPAAQANADLLLSCLQGKSTPADEFTHTLSQILGLSSADVEADDPSPEESDAIITGKYHEASVGLHASGAALAVRLVQRLLQTVVQQPSLVLQWQTPVLDSLASLLARPGDSVSPTQGNSDESNHAAPPAGDSASRQTAADAADLATSVAAAALDASEHTDAAQETPVSHISNGASGLSREGPASMSQADTSCAQLLGMLVSGIGNISLLSDQAVQQVLSQLKSTLETADSVQGNSCM